MFNLKSGDLKIIACVMIPTMLAAFLLLLPHDPKTPILALLTLGQGIILTPVLVIFRRTLNAQTRMDAIQGRNFPIPKPPLDHI